ncbi:MAG: hypothetical protein ACOX87_09425 [Chloroflexota bacterium]|jgi:hypothetical protein
MSPFRSTVKPCYNCSVINYSRQNVERQLIADQALWRRVPVAMAALLWPAEVIILGWHTGWWIGALTVVALGFVSAVIPSRLKVNVYLIDLLEQFVRLPLEIGWLLLFWHLWMREPLFPVLGQPLVGALAITVSLWALSRFLAFVTRLIAQQAPMGRHA